jgi:hypothetical protein
VVPVEETLVELAEGEGIVPDPVLIDKLEFAEGIGMFEDEAAKPVDSRIVTLVEGEGIKVEPVPTGTLVLAVGRGIEEAPVE